MTVFEFQEKYSTLEEKKKHYLICQKKKHAK